MGSAEPDLRAATGYFSQGGVVDMTSGVTDETEELRIKFGPHGSYRWWEGATRVILVYSKSEMAGCLGVSLKTVDSWVRQGAPVLEQGSNGRPYSLDAVAFVEWVRARRGGISIDQLRRRDEAGYRAFLRSELERLGAERGEK
jgi:Phage DNA packaging protein Nu1